MGQCCNSPRAFSAPAEAVRGSRYRGAESPEAGSLGAPVVSGRTSVHRDGSTITGTVQDVGTTAGCRVGSECAAVQRSRCTIDNHPAPFICTISLEYTAHEGGGGADVSSHSSPPLQ